MIGTPPETSVHTIVCAVDEEYTVAIYPTRLNDFEDPYRIEHVAAVTLVAGIYIIDYMSAGVPITRTYNSMRYEVAIT